MSEASTPKGVIVRDLLIFQVKLWLDGLKDLFLAPLSFIAAIFDLVLGPSAKGLRLYRVLRVGERFDLWLNLFGAAEAAEGNSRGLFARSERGAESLIGQLEEIGGDSRPKPVRR